MNQPIFNIESLSEDVDLEAKRAGGRDGKGHLPNDIFETYSAFANTDGGVILLGISENKEGDLIVTGIENTRKVLDQLWNQLNNPEKVSINLLNDKDIELTPTADGKHVISIHIPRASRKQRPVFINGNPLKGTHKRIFSGDYHCDEIEVRRMMAEQLEDTRDATLLENSTLDDLSTDSLRAYRNRFASLKPDHPFNASDDRQFLKQLGAWASERATGNDGLTLAGLLMFGKHEAISEFCPLYFVDYREIPISKSKTEWTDRITPDGTWSGNLYDFYTKTIQRLTQDLKIPFQLQGADRTDDTRMHKAIRESLVNALVHADYSATSPILIIKAPDYFEFRNPGDMRISIKQAFEGGHSDCRNRTLQKMFTLIGLGEQAGSGVPRVIDNWKSQHYRFPELRETHAPETTLMTLRTVSLLPENALDKLAKQFGNAFTQLDEYERLALVTAEIEGFVTNERLQQISPQHPYDITQLLKNLVTGRLLIPDGKGRATTYHLVGAAIIDLASSEASSSNHLASSSNHLASSSNHLEQTTSPLSDPNLLHIASQVSDKGKVSSELLKTTILELCSHQFLSTDILAKLLNRTPGNIRQRFIKPMVQAGELERRFPNQPNHEQQAYRTK